MSEWTLARLAALPGVACRFVGRGRDPRPDPASLVGWTGAAGAPIPLATVKQVHSARCLEAGPAIAALGPGRHEVGEGDALVTSERGVALGIATADCLPLVAVDPEAGVLATVHAGWRGTLEGVLESALSMMIGRHGARPERILVGAGPAAGRCCYQIGPEVERAFGERRPSILGRIFADLPVESGGGRALDLIEANRAQAEAAGVPPDRFESVGVCTLCNPAETHSYRREREHAGRMWLLAALLP